MSDLYKYNYILVHYVPKGSQNKPYSRPTLHSFTGKSISSVTLKKVNHTESCNPSWKIWEQKDESVCIMYQGYINADDGKSQESMEARSGVLINVWAF